MNMNTDIYNNLFHQTAGFSETEDKVDYIIRRLTVSRDVVQNIAKATSSQRDKSVGLCLERSLDSQQLQWRHQVNRQ